MAKFLRTNIYQTASSFGNGTLILPWLEVLDFILSSWVLHPLDDLSHGDEVDIIMLLGDFVNPEEEGFQEFWIILQPRSMEVETHGGTILLVMSVVIK